MESGSVIERDWGFKVYEGTDKYGFISYKREDSAIVAKYAKALSDRGVNLWYDYGIAAGRWEDTISERLMGAAYLVVFVTRLTFTSEEIKKEVKTAKARGIDVIPVFLENIDTSQIEPKRATFLIELQIMQGIPAFNKWNEQEVADELLRLITNKTASDDSISFVAAQQPESNRALLTGEELSECVSVLYDTEQSLLCQKETMINLIEKTNELGQSKTIEKPTEPIKQAYPQKQAYPRMPKNEFTFFEEMFQNGFYCYSINFFITIFCAINYVTYFCCTYLFARIELDTTELLKTTLKMIVVLLFIWGIVHYTLMNDSNAEKIFDNLSSKAFKINLIAVVLCFISVVVINQSFDTNIILSCIYGIVAVICCILAGAVIGIVASLLGLILNYTVYPILSIPFRIGVSTSRYNEALNEYRSQVNSIEHNYNVQIQSIENTHAEAMSQYQRDMQAYRERFHQDELRVKSENQQIQAINLTVGMLLKKYSETENSIKKLYDKSPINANYRHIIPMGYMNELLKLRVCNRLDSKDGLNYTIRSELSNKQIVAEINDVIDDFDELVGSKMMMYYDVKQQFEKAKKLADDMASFICDKVSYDTLQSDFDGIVNSSPVSTYITELKAKEQEYLANRIFQ